MMVTRPKAARPMRALTPCTEAAALEVLAGAEAEALEDPAEAELAAVLEALKVTP